MKSALYLIIIDRRIDGSRSSTMDAFAGRLIDFPVQRQDDHQWHVKCATGGKYLEKAMAMWLINKSVHGRDRWSAHLIWNILRDHALLLLDTLQIVWILPTELWCQGHNHRRRPNAKDHHKDTIAGPRVDVIYIGDRPVTAKKIKNIYIL